ncbi:MAG: hypothetical protein N2450_03640 [bacterium]|nr:hypothetical protein [bacterium]
MAQLRHRRRRWKSKLKHWFSDARYRNQRRYTFVGVFVILGGIITASGISFVSTSGWLVILILIVVTIVWLFIRFFDDV